MNQTELIFRRSTGQWIRFDRIDGKVTISYSKLPEFTLEAEEEVALLVWLRSSGKD